MQIRQLTQDDLPDWGDLLAICFDRQPPDMRQLIRFLQAIAPLIAFGVWDGPKLVGQYSCLLRSICVPTHDMPLPVGVSINMAVHPAYRGRGLVKQVAQPVYAAVKQAGGVAGVGFSNAEGVKVDKNSKGYAYQVLGKMQSTVAFITHRPSHQPLRIVRNLPQVKTRELARCNQICFAKTPSWLETRFAAHPFRQYQFAASENGVVVYRTFRRCGLKVASLLAVEADDKQAILGSWLQTIWQNGARIIHVLATPQSMVVDTLKTHCPVVKLPITRSPYHLTIKPLSETAPNNLFNFANWDSLGGDIL